MGAFSSTSTSNVRQGGLSTSTRGALVVSGLLKSSLGTGRGGWLLGSEVVFGVVGSEQSGGGFEEAAAAGIGGRGLL